MVLLINGSALCVDWPQGVSPGVGTLSDRCAEAVYRCAINSPRNDGCDGRAVGQKEFDISSKSVKYITPNTYTETPRLRQEAIPAEACAAPCRRKRGWGAAAQLQPGQEEQQSLRGAMTLPLVPPYTDAEICDNASSSLTVCEQPPHQTSPTVDAVYAHEVS
eukprot:GHVQ01009889.1.p2 GENE.GHVQ01009889.1~~GHVQ01009889.1.p2  ORF type:complete len:162 (-),score=24.25 GHVQ01009889.1:3529-4014(-)